MRKIVIVSLPLVVSLAACDLRKPSPIAPSKTVSDSTSQDSGKIASVYPSNGPDLIAFVSGRYPERLAGGVSYEERIANMEFLRDRIIEAGKCGGMDLGWNLKRGGPEISRDFITERVDGQVIGHDIAIDYDNAAAPLRLQWGGGDFPFYKEYPAPVCD